MTERTPVPMQELHYLIRGAPKKWRWAFTNHTRLRSTRIYLTGEQLNRHREFFDTYKVQLPEPLDAKELYCVTETGVQCTANK